MLATQKGVRDQGIIDDEVIPLPPSVVYSICGFITAKQGEWEGDQGWMPDVAVWGRAPGWEPTDVECPCKGSGPCCGRAVHHGVKNRMKNRLNCKRVSFVIPMNISVVAFSRTAICGWLSSCWLPKSHHTTHTCLCLTSPVFSAEPRNNAEN